jgi:hypothetical protein
MTVLPYAEPAPTPKTETPPPVPAATPIPTAIPAPIETPIPPRATPTATPVPTPTPSPSEPSPTPDSSESARPSPPAAATSPGGTGSAGREALLVAPLDGSADGVPDDLGVGLDVLTLLDGPFVWFVPGAAVGVPGLLVIAFVGLQAVGAMAWIPAMRRLGGDDRRRRIRSA